MKKILTTILAAALAGGAWGATTQVATQADLASAVAAAAAGDTVQITAAGTYTLPSIPQDITVEGVVAGVEFECVKTEASGTTDCNICDVPNGVTFKSVTFRFVGNSQTSDNLGWTGAATGGSLVFEDCNFYGEFFNYYMPMVFRNCVFTQTVNNYHMWVYGPGRVSYIGCTFNYQKKCLHVYNHGYIKTHDVYLKDCVFNPANASDSDNKGDINVKNTEGSPTSITIIIDSCGTTNAKGLVQFQNALANNPANTAVAIGTDIVLDEDGDIVSGEFTTLYAGSTADSIIASGSTITDNGDGTYAVVDPTATPVAKIGDVEYTTLAAAFAAANESATAVTVTLLADVTDGTLGAKGIVIDGSNTITLDLAGHGITCTDGSAANNRMIKLAGTTTLNVVNSGETVGVMDVLGANTAVADTSTSTTLPYGVFRAEAGTTLNVTAANGNIKLVNGRAWGLNVKLCGATATLTGVTIESQYGGGIEVTEADLGTGSVTGSATLTGCTFTQTGYFDHCSTTLSVSGGSALTVNGGTYSGEQALYVFSSGGVITVEDGTFTGNGGRAAFVAAIDTQTYPSYTGGMTLKDGKFSGSFNITSPAYVSATGGLYSADPSAYVAAGCAAVDNADETTKAAYPYAVGKVTAGELTEKSGATETAATYTVPVAVTDGNGDTLSSLGDALTVSVSVAEGDIADTTLSDIKVDSVVGSAVAAAGGTADSIAVEIAVSTNDMVVGESSVSYEVKPEAVVTVTKDEATTTTTNELTNADLASGASFTFDLDVTATGVAAGGWVKVTHVSSDYPDETSLCKAKAGANGAIVVTVTTTHFSTFTATPADTSGEDAALLPSVTNTLASANSFGALAIVGSAAANAFVAAPFGAFSATGDVGIAAADVVQAASLSEDDRMYVWNGAAEGGEQRYEVYKVSGGAWVADGNKVTVASNGTVSVGSESPDAVAVPTGTGVFVRRSDVSRPIYVYGQALAAPSSSQVALAPGLALVSPPSTLALSAIDLNSLSWEDVRELDASCVKTLGGVPRAVKVTGGPDFIYYRNQSNDVIRLYRYGGRWGTQNNLTRQDAGVVPAGTAFWFMNNGGEAKVTWTAAE